MLRKAQKFRADSKMIMVNRISARRLRPDRHEQDQRPRSVPNRNILVGFPARNRTAMSAPPVSAPEPKAAPGQKPARAPEFLVQMIATGDPDLRKVLGRRDVASARERAYAFAAAHKSPRVSDDQITTDFSA